MTWEFQVTDISRALILDRFTLNSSATSVYNGMLAKFSSGEWALADGTTIQPTQRARGMFYEQMEMMERSYDLTGLSNENLIADASGNPMAGNYCKVVTGRFRCAVSANHFHTSEDPTTVSSVVGAGVWGSPDTDGLLTMTDPTGVAPIGQYLGTITSGSTTLYEFLMDFETEPAAV